MKNFRLTNSQLVPYEAASDVYEILEKLDKGEYDFAGGNAGWNAIQKLKTRIDEPSKGIPDIFLRILNQSGLLENSKFKEYYRDIFVCAVEDSLLI